MASPEATERLGTESRASGARVAVNGALALVLAGALNGLVRTIAITALDVPNVFPLWWAPVLVATAVCAIGATVVYGLLARHSDRPNRTFTILAAIVLVLSFAGPVNAFRSPPPELAGAPWTVLATLLVMHVTAAVTIVVVLTRASSSGATSR